MTAPDKIYVSRNFSEDNSPHGLWYLNKSEHDANVEYIRKYALIEWIQEVRAIPHENAIVRDLAFQEIINKINSI